jgi:hypothetical protein
MNLLCGLEFHDQRFTGMGSLESKAKNCWERCKPMKRTILASLALAFMLASSTFTQTAQPTCPDYPLSSDRAREENAYTLGVQAYLWGIPLAYNYDTYQAGLKVGAVESTTSESTPNSVSALLTAGLRATPGEKLFVRQILYRNITPPIAT